MYVCDWTRGRVRHCSIGPHAALAACPENGPSGDDYCLLPGRSAFPESSIGMVSLRRSGMVHQQSEAIG